MMLRDLVRLGERIEIGAYEFTAERIIAFAEKFDPQYFHLDAVKAKDSVLGGLCASGWHISAAMMKCNVAMIELQARAAIAAGGTPPKFGPSPGFKNLKWLKPAYAGDTVTYAMRYTGDRPIPNRPGWNMTEISYEGVNQRGELVFTADCSVVEFD